MTLFYDHLINLNRLTQKLEQLELASHELDQVKQQVDQLIEHHVIEIIFDNLHQNHHHYFILHLEQAPHDPQLLNWLRQHIQNIDQLITQQINQVETQILQELFQE